jgi:hypothetical protein
VSEDDDDDDNDDNNICKLWLIRNVYTDHVGCRITYILSVGR